jgi:hypothetical protein
MSSTLGANLVPRGEFGPWEKLLFIVVNIYAVVHT